MCQVDGYKVMRRWEDRKKGRKEGGRKKGEREEGRKGAFSCENCGNWKISLYMAFASVLLLYSVYRSVLLQRSFEGIKTSIPSSHCHTYDSAFATVRAPLTFLLFSFFQFFLGFFSACLDFEEA